MAMVMCRFFVLRMVMYARRVVDNRSWHEQHAVHLGSFSPIGHCFNYSAMCEGIDLIDGVFGSHVFHSARVK